MSLCLWIQEGLFLLCKRAPPLLAASYPAAAYVSSQSLRTVVLPARWSRSFPRAFVPKTVVNAPRNDYFKQPADQGIQSGFLRKCISSFLSTYSTSAPSANSRFVLHRFLPFRAFDRLRFSLSLSLFLFSLPFASYFAFPVSFLLVLLFFAALFLSNFRLSFYGYVTPYVYVLCLLLLLRCCVLSFSLFSFFVVLSVFEWFCFHKYDFNHFVFSFSMYLSKICCVSWFIYVFPCHFYAILFILSV